MNSARFDRRSVLVFAAGAALASCRTSTSRSRVTELENELARLEGGGRLGVAVFDTRDGSVFGRRLDERFALCSTFKLVLAAMVLERAELGGRALAERVSFGSAELVSHGAVTRAAVEAAAARGASAAELSLGELAHAAQTSSDGVAANLLLRGLGGPAALNAYCRAHGDTFTRLERYEPEMNDVRPGEERDTTTPRAMAQLVGTLLGGALAPAARRTLRQWMIETQTGAARVRRGLPSDWIAGDKTGTGGGDGITVKCNDVVWIEPPGRAPLVVAAYYDTGVVAEWPSDADQAVLAEVGRCVARLH